ncbi:MAG: 16S rRNA (guanine(527)-N(7))-methyltransferase RsmG [Bacteroidia bacterium]|nr:MAG: 16S rRNA (guanine(527)-N(7))-methyltransferase RsmG [Bacteroidia bacterium]
MKEIKNEEILSLPKYFKELSDRQLQDFDKAMEVYKTINRQINLISPKDIDNLFERHILHSLSIARYHRFAPGETIADVGSGGGFPGIPLAIFFPETNFTLIDSIGKKIKAVQQIIEDLKLTNVQAIQVRSPEHRHMYDHITGRAVAAFPKFYQEVKHMLCKGGKIFYLKGGDFKEEMKNIKSFKINHLEDFFEGDFFRTKKIIIVEKK